MSSPIHSARCVARAGATVEIELAPTTAGIADFPLSPFFALALLHECATTIVYRAPGDVWRWGGAPSPLGAAVSEEEILDLSSERGDHVRKRVLVGAFIGSAAYVRADHWTPGRDDVQAVFDRALAKKQPVPTAVLRIETTDPDWVSHVEVGMLWDVYAFDDDAVSWPLLT